MLDEVISLLIDGRENDTIKIGGKKGDLGHYVRFRDPNARR